MGARRAVHIRFSTVCYQPEKSGKFKIVREKGIIKENGEDIQNIPYKETNNYVRKILRDYKIYQKLYISF